MHIRMFMVVVWGREWERGGTGVGSGWAQLYVLLSPTRLDDMDFVFSRPPWDGGGRGGGEWEVDGRNFRFCPPGGA